MYQYPYHSLFTTFFFLLLYFEVEFCSMLLMVEVLFTCLFPLLNSIWKDIGRETS